MGWGWEQELGPAEVRSLVANESLGPRPALRGRTRALIISGLARGPARTMRQLDPSARDSDDHQLRGDDHDDGGGGDDDDDGDGGGDGDSKCATE